MGDTVAKQYVSWNRVKKRESSAVVLNRVAAKLVARAYVGELGVVNP